jgi:hypothetical protein
LPYTSDNSKTNNTAAAKSNTNPEQQQTTRVNRVPRQTQSLQFILAALIITGSFVFIAVMLSIHSDTLTRVLTSAKITDANVTTIKELIDHVDTSNQTIFNILLPVFSAWVGVVVAFYFTSEQAKRAQEALSDQADKAREALTKVYDLDKERLSKVNVQALLDKFPETKNVHKVTKKKETKVSDLKAAFGKFSDVVIVDENDKPLGILYRQDFNRILPAEDNSDPKYTEKLNESILGANDGKSGILFEINQGFLSVEGLKNYVRTTTDETLWEARNKMFGLGNQINDVRCIVIDDPSTSKVIAIFTYDSILYFVK